MLSREQGKPVNQALMEIFSASMWFSYFASLEIQPEVLQDDGNKRIQVIRKPLGVVAAITPWELPGDPAVVEARAGLLAGNTVVAKPPYYAAVDADGGRGAARGPLPAGVLNVISGGNDLGAELTKKHPRSARSRSPATSRPARRSCSPRPTI